MTKSLLISSIDHPGSVALTQSAGPCKEASHGLHTVLRWEARCCKCRAVALTLPARRESAMPQPEQPAPVSYTSEELSLWQRLVVQSGPRLAAIIFERETGKPHDPAFLL